VIAARRCRQTPSLRTTHNIEILPRDLAAARTVPTRALPLQFSPDTPQFHTLCAPQLSSYPKVQLSSVPALCKQPFCLFAGSSDAYKKGEPQSNAIHQFPLSSPPLPCLHVASSGGVITWRSPFDSIRALLVSNQKAETRGRETGKQQNKHFPHHPMTRSSPLSPHAGLTGGPQLDTVSYCVFVSAYLFVCLHQTRVFA
jgi:hypothetical protein